MFNNIPPITRNLIIINVVVYLAALLLPQLDYYLAGYYPFSSNFKSWQIITHMFMHGSPMHILFNMFTLYSFGPILEQSLGDKKYIILYFLSGLGAFFLFNLWNFVEVQNITNNLVGSGYDLQNLGETIQNLKSTPLTAQQQSWIQELIGIYYTRMVGASGAIFGVIAAFATLYPEARIGIMFIPVPVKVKYLLPIIIVGSVVLGVTGNVGGVAHLAHVGGAIVGFILAKIWKRHLYRFK
ncbi:rhomboid family intramembrane serine protease [Chryseobacterium sp. LC2016-29]|uniref:rhomboid family intramembrane serine protease n=1 Tax=Chryseobacterium sp. LC2016-29 TaxID=2897331 RepID=UPI001E45D502|nr:rhomboid family intramembrane serine protease [Chryseobacterium sp. LC2016-29]MCD0477060.1 rhomboid family intramembrane serine protease [Chryseobacterium sp. LC2016-29]